MTDRELLQGLFDNRATYRREGYNKGKLVASLAADALLQHKMMPARLHRDWYKPWGHYPDAPSTSTRP